MSTQQRKGQRASLAKKKLEVHNLKAAYIIPQEVGDQMIQILGELPSKYYPTMVGPMLEAFRKAFRGNVIVDIDPNKSAPPIPAAAAGKAPKKAGLRPTRTVKVKTHEK